MRLVESNCRRRADPADVAELLADASSASTLEDKSRAAIPAFVPSDFELVYRALAAIQAANLATGRRFLEWGSGIGVVACLATRLGFDAVGIEIEPPLVEIADDLAADHDIDVEFACGSFVPARRRSQPSTSPTTSPGSRTTGPDGYDDLDSSPTTSTSSSPTPGPARSKSSSTSSPTTPPSARCLLTYHGHEGVRLQRKETFSEAQRSQDDTDAGEQGSNLLYRKSACSILLSCILCALVSSWLILHGLSHAPRMRRRS